MPSGLKESVQRHGAKFTQLDSTNDTCTCSHEAVDTCIAEKRFPMYLIHACVYDED